MHYKIDDHIIFVQDDTILTVLPNGYIVAKPNADEESVARAKSLGYWEYDDAEPEEIKRALAQMTFDHEVLHALLAYWTKMGRSPTFDHLAIGETWEGWNDEEAVVLALQRLLNTLGISVRDLAMPFLTE